MQQNITLRNSPPSASSMQEGQIVLAKDSKGLSMYTKQGGQLFSSQFNSGSFVDRSGDRINPTSVKAKDLSYTKFTDYRTFQHTFQDDIGTDKTYLPWAGHEENDNMRFFTSYLAPFKMTFYKLFIRPASVTATSDYTFAIDFSKDGAATSYELGSYIHRNVLLTDDETHFVINGSDFLINAPYDSLTVNAGEKAGISIQASTDPSGNTYWTITSVWKVEVDLS
tara:strand:- start:115 stop:786 length:672 start_codon:yes stop_codon:yes gene_type:complete